MYTLLFIAGTLFIQTPVPIYTISVTFSTSTPFIYGEGMVLNVPEYNNDTVRTLGFPGGCSGLCKIGEASTTEIASFIALGANDY